MRAGRRVFGYEGIAVLSVKTKKHPGFARVAKRIAKREGVPLQNARKELAASTRRASKSATRANPNLFRVKRGKK